ncbi:hypothetical protein B0I37DRAFT_97814 [Chaetomium sp. MPI-CAGE-AT-0009]|nr:hypothetical protein B0I37DRAFT_97814 [Chaetomium sp. MPI-CAGE-AT-0009]
MCPESIWHVPYFHDRGTGDGRDMAGTRKPRSPGGWSSATFFMRPYPVASQGWECPAPDSSFFSAQTQRRASSGRVSRVISRVIKSPAPAVQADPSLASTRSSPFPLAKLKTARFASSRPASRGWRIPSRLLKKNLVSSARASGCNATTAHPSLPLAQLPLRLSLPLPFSPCLSEAGAHRHNDNAGPMQLTRPVRKWSRIFPGRTLKPNSEIHELPEVVVADLRKRWAWPGC